MGIFFKLGKDRAVKGEGWTAHLICCAQDAVRLYLPTALMAIRLWETFFSHRISLSTGVRDFSILACYLSLGSESYSPIMLISPTQFVTCHVNFMQNMKLTVSDVQEMSQ